MEQQQNSNKMNERSSNKNLDHHMFHQIESTTLPKDYQPRDNDVLCGCGRVWFHSGNKVFNEMIRNNLEQYASAKTALDKYIMITDLINSFRNRKVLFVKLDTNTGRWYDIGNQQAHAKASHALRLTLANLKMDKKTTQKTQIQQLKPQQQQQQQQHLGQPGQRQAQHYRHQQLHDQQQSSVQQQHQLLYKHFLQQQQEQNTTKRTNMEKPNVLEKRELNESLLMTKATRIVTPKKNENIHQPSIISQPITKNNPSTMLSIHNTVARQRIDTKKHAVDRTNLSLASIGTIKNQQQRQDSTNQNSCMFFDIESKSYLSTSLPCNENGEVNVSSPSSVKAIDSKEISRMLNDEIIECDISPYIVD